MGLPNALFCYCFVGQSEYYVKALSGGRWCERGIELNCSSEITTVGIPRTNKSCKSMLISSNVFAQLTIAACSFRSYLHDVLDPSFVAVAAIVLLALLFLSLVSGPDPLEVTWLVPMFGAGVSPDSSRRRFCSLQFIKVLPAPPPSAEFDDVVVVGSSPLLPVDLLLSCCCCWR